MILSLFLFVYLTHHFHVSFAETNIQLHPYCTSDLTKYMLFIPFADRPLLLLLLLLILLLLNYIHTFNSDSQTDTTYQNFLFSYIFLCS